jgi:succinoglycan biosynthesis protein ExoA
MHNVLVVIPALNEAATIAGVLSALAEDAPRNALLRFVVADGGSSDGTVERVKAFARERTDLDVHVLHNPDRLPGPGVNRAVVVHGAQADVLIRADAHASYDRGFCRHLLDALDRTGADAVVVPMDSVGDTCFQKAVAWVSDTPVGSGGSAHRGGRRSSFVDHGHHAAFRLQSFRRAGGYDATLPGNEDAELDCRQRALGARIWLDADVRMSYHPRASVARLARQYFVHGRGRSCTVRRHPASLRLRQFAVPLHLLLCVAAFALAAWWPWLLAWPAAYAAVLCGTSLALAWRHRSACALLAGPAAAVMHGAWAVGFFCGCITHPQRRWRPELVAPLGDAT